MKIGLLWHSLASGNLGVDALTLSNIAIVRQELEKLGLDAHLIVIGMRDNHDDPTLRKSIADVFVVDGRSILSPRGYWSLLASLDAIIDIGAGDSFAQIYGPKRFAYLWATKALAYARKVPLVLAPQTIGPFTGTIYRKLAKAVMNRARCVVARDLQSFNVAREIAPHARVALATDVAFELPFTRAPTTDGAKPVRIGLNASGLLYRQAESGENRFGLSYNYAGLIHALLETFATDHSVQIELIAHATSRTDPGDDDGALADRLAAKYPFAKRVPDFSGAEAAKSHISGLDVLVAGRMHACIAAFSAGVPVVPTAYSRKFSGLFGSLGYDCILPETGFSVEEALQFVLTHIQERDRLKSQIATARTNVDARLQTYRDELQELFRSVSNVRR